MNNINKLKLGDIVFENDQRFIGIVIKDNPYGSKKQENLILAVTSGMIYKKEFVFYIVNLPSDVVF